VTTTVARGPIMSGIEQQDLPSQADDDLVAAACPSLRPPDPGTGRVAGRTSYLLAETGFERSLSERAR